MKRPKLKAPRILATRTDETTGKTEIAEAKDIIECVFCETGFVFRVGRELAHTSPWCKEYETLDPGDFVDASIERLRLQQS